MTDRWQTAEGHVVELVVLDRGYGPVPQFRVTSQHGFHVGYFLDEKALARRFDLAQFTLLPDQVG